MVRHRVPEFYSACAIVCQLQQIDRFSGRLLLQVRTTMYCIMCSDNSATWLLFQVRRTPHWKSQNSLTWLLLQVKRSRNVQWKEDWKGYYTLLCGGKVIENYSGLPLPSQFWRLKIQIQIHYSSAWRQSHWKLLRSASSISVLTPVTDIHPITAQPDYWYTWSIKDIVSRSFHSDTFF